MGNQFSINRNRPANAGEAHASSTEAKPAPDAASPSRQVRVATAPSILEGLRKLRLPFNFEARVPPLPEETWAEIARRVDTKTLHRMRAVSKTLKAAADTEIRQLTVNTVEALQAAKRYACLETLKMDGYFGDADLEGLPASLRELDLFSTRYVSAKGLAHLSKLPLVRLKVRANGIHAEAARALAASTTLTALDIRGNGIGDAGAQALAANTSITSLDASFNDIGAAGARALAANTTLTSLDLGFNAIGDEGLQALANNTTLTSLTVGSCEIGDAGAAALANNTALTSVDLTCNHIGEEGAEGLAANTVLTSLDLTRNSISDRGAAALAGNTTLTSLCVNFNDIYGRGGALAGREHHAHHAGYQLQPDR
ncbi:GALA protein [Ralstonia pseudosolanacearum]|uniref:F-box protein n=1 Tax=Ralstonia pseudosolanacearum TaxID=1310165 RepID=UPI003CF2810D